MQNANQLSGFRCNTAAERGLMVSMEPSGWNPIHQTPASAAPPDVVHCKCASVHSSVQSVLAQLGEASKKINCFFFRKTPKGGRGGLAQSKIFLSEKTEIFLDFFFQKGGGSHLFQKGVIIKQAPKAGGCAS